MKHIEINAEKQLFIDDYMIESLGTCKRILHEWEKDESNPTFVKELSWEGAGPVAGQAYYDRVDGRYKMWYGTYDNKTGKYPAGYAESEDGLSWERNPDMQPEGERGAVLIDPRGKAGNVRFFSEGYLRPLKELPGRAALYESIDGISWQKTRGKGWWEGPSDVIDIMWDSRRQKYVSYHKIWRVKGTSVEGEPVKAYFATFTPRQTRKGVIEIEGRELFPGIREVKYEIVSSYKGKDDGGGGIVSDEISMLRVIGRAESSDFINWSEHTIVLEPDEDEGMDVQYYGMPVFEYEGIYLGLPRYFEGISGRMDVRFAFSRNGVDFKIPDRKLVLKCGGRGSWDGGMVIVAPNPLGINNKLCLYYGAYHNDHTYKGSEYKAATGRAWLRQDGFVSITGGVMITKPVNLNGKKLYFNGKGKIITRVLGPDGEICASSEWQGDSTAEPVVWDSESIKHRIVRLYFDLTKGDLFSLWTR